MPHAHTLTKDQEAALATALRETYFRGWDQGFLASEQGRNDLADQVHRRYDHCSEKIVPWIERHLALRGKRVVEIGCGAGSSTSGLAWHAGVVEAYDIDAQSVDAAKRRAQILGQENINFYALPPAALLEQARRNHPAGTADVAVLYAVLEHQTVGERLETLKSCWEMLSPGGLLVIIETPNRLAFFDYHTALLPFFHMLPPEVAVRYAECSPRSTFPESMRQALAVSEETAIEKLTRWGRGVSYHEFELALGDLEGLVVGDGYDPEILSIKGISVSERCLYTYWVAAGIKAPVGFVRQDLDLILRKPGGNSEVVKRPARPELIHAALA
jgi:2-polyprenyl-3-methyl-5-hydroxy-6-metoxy-1,4-benzoquinol methylase